MADGLASHKSAHTFPNLISMKNPLHFYIVVRLIRPERPLRCQPRASPWVYDAEVDFALKGQKLCVLVLLLLQSVICRGISTPRALPWADIFLPLWGVPSPCHLHLALNTDGWEGARDDEIFLPDTNAFYFVFIVERRCGSAEGQGTNEWG